MPGSECDGCILARALALSLVQSQNGIYGDATGECLACRRQWTASVKPRKRLCMVCHNRAPQADSSRCAGCENPTEGTDPHLWGSVMRLVSRWRAD